MTKKNKKQYQLKKLYQAKGQNKVLLHEKMLGRKYKR